MRRRPCYHKKVSFVEMQHGNPNYLTRLRVCREREDLIHIYRMTPLTKLGTKAIVEVGRKD